MRLILIVAVKSYIYMSLCKVVDFCVFEYFYLINIIYFVLYPSVYYVYVTMCVIVCQWMCSSLQQKNEQLLRVMTSLACLYVHVYIFMYF